MKLCIRSIATICVVLLSAICGTAQSSGSPTSADPVPRLVKFAGSVRDEAGLPKPGITGVTFALYKDQYGGAPLWLETQNVQADSKGNYTVLLGSTKPEGLSADLFTSNEARWLGVQPEGQAEQSRVVFVSVPYALKAADAETIGGLPPSAFVRANPENAALGGSSAVSGETVADSHSNNGQPLVLQTVKTSGGTTNFLPIWTGTTTIGNSAVFQSGGKVGIGTTSPGGTLDVKGTTLVEGTLNLPQTSGTTVGVIDLGGLPFLHACCSASAENTFVGINAGNFTTSGVGHNTAIGFKALSANSTGNENTATGYFALAANTSGNSNTAFGHEALQNNTKGFNNTAVGFSALLSNGTGTQNTAVGDSALAGITTGFNNTAIGFAADASDLTGSYNTSLGFQSGTLINNLTNATAIGAFAGAEQSNSIVLGCTLACPNGAISPNVGIGTNTPVAHLDVTGHGADVFVGDPGCGLNPFAGIGFGSSGFNNCTSYSMVGNGIDTFVGAPSGNIFFRTNSNSTTPMLITAGGQVGVGTTAPDNLLTVNGSADKPGGGSWGTFSDSRLKTVRDTYTAGLDAILKLTPVRYRYKEQNAMGIKDSQEHVGFVAQDVEKVIPEAVSRNSQGYLLVNNDPILWTMLNAIKQQQVEIETLTRSAVKKDAQIRRLTAQVQTSQKAQLKLQRRLEQVEVNSGNNLALATTRALPALR